MDGIDELNPGDAVTAEQMRALFGAGLHPLAAQRQLLAAHGIDPVAQLTAAAGAANSTPPTTGPPSWTGGSTTPATATPAGAPCHG